MPDAFVERPSAPARISVDQIYLDPENPRLVMSGRATEEALITALYESEALDELAPSFIDNGYFAEEPLVVVPDGDDRWIAVEGNRRLATLKLLRDPALRARVGVQGWATLTEEQRERLSEIPCVVYQHRELVLPFLGFRHITGAKKWAPFQKARFIAQMIDSGRTLQDVEDLIGDTGQTVKKLYQDYVVFNQVRDDLQLPERAIREKFSLLEVTLGQRNIKEHLGMPRRLPASSVEKLVPDGNLEQLEEVVGWVFGTETQEPVIKDSREISNRLAPVLGKEVSLARLRESRDLESAYDFSDGEKSYLIKRMIAAEKALRDISALLAVHHEDEEIRAGVRRLTALSDGLSRLTAE